MVFLPKPHQKSSRDRQRGKLRGGNRQPNAVDVQKEGQDQHGGCLEDQGAEEGDGRRDRAVAQGGEEGGAENGEARREEGQGIEAEPPSGQLIEPLVVANENSGQRGGEGQCEPDHGGARQGGQDQAFAEERFQLGVVARAVVVAHNGGGSYGVTDEYRHKEEADVHDDTEGRDAILSRQPHELVVVEHTGDRHGNIGHQFGGAVGGGPRDGFRAPGKT